MCGGARCFVVSLVKTVDMDVPVYVFWNHSELPTISSNWVSAALIRMDRDVAGEHPCLLQDHIQTMVIWCPEHVVVGWSILHFYLPTYTSGTVLDRPHARTCFILYSLRILLFSGTISSNWIQPE